MPEETLEVTQADPASGDLALSDFRKVRAGETLNVPKEAVKETPVEVETPEVEVKGDDDAPAKVEDGKPDKKPGKPRIEKLTREKYDLEDKLAKALEEVERYRPKESAKSEPGEPVFDDKYLAKAGKEGKTYEQALQEFTREHSKWAYQQEKAADSKKSAEEALHQQQKETFDAYNKRMEAFRETTDIDELVNEVSKAGHDIPRTAHLPIIEMENGPEILEYLCKNLDVLDSLSKMSDVRVIAKIGAISDMLEKNAAKDEKDEKGERPAKSSQAPDPINPVRTGTGKPSVDPENMSLADYKKWHAKQASA